MPCDCPQDLPRPKLTGGCNYVCYSGGSAAGIYSLVGEALPDVEMAHGRPVVHPDGSLEFPGPPPAITGYREEGNALYPAWPPCPLRMLRVRVVDGVLSIDGICGDPAAALFGLEVKPEQCQECPSHRVRP
jgi:hypothetical protein